MTEADLQAEVERLRAEVESYRQREFESVRARLVAALSDIETWRAEAQRISQAAQELDALRVAEIAELRGRLQSTPRDNWQGANAVIKAQQRSVA